MSGALMQITNTGPELVQYTEPPEINLFIQHYPRFANFAMQIEEDPSNIPSNFGQSVVFTFNRGADFIGQTFFSIELPSIQIDGSNMTTAAWIEYIGAYIFSRIAIRVNNQVISECADHMVYLWQQLTTAAAKKDAMDWMLGQRPELVETVPGMNRIILPSATILVPVPFWFSTGSFLPIACCNNAMPIDMTVTIRPLNELVVIDSTATVTPLGQLNVKCYSNMVYLNTRSRNDLVGRPLHLTVEQFFSSGKIIGGTSAQIPLTNSGICKEVIIVAQNQEYEKQHLYTNFGLASNNPRLPLINTLAFRFNGVTLMNYIDGALTRCLEPVWYHTAAPDNIHVHSFCLDPESSSLTGGIDMNMILNPTAEVTIVTKALTKNTSGTTTVWEEINVANKTVYYNDGVLTPGDPALYCFYSYTVHVNTLVFKNGFAGLNVV